MRTKLEVVVDVSQAESGSRAACEAKQHDYQRLTVLGFQFLIASKNNALGEVILPIQLTIMWSQVYT